MEYDSPILLGFVLFVLAFFGFITAIISHNIWTTWSRADNTKKVACSFVVGTSCFIMVFVPMVFYVWGPLEP